MLRLLCLAVLLLPFFLSGCARRPDPGTLVMIIESSPTNLDPRAGIDAQSERIDMLIFDALFRRDEHFNLQPMLAESYEIPNPLTYIFHLRTGVRFHDGRSLTARDVKYTIDSMLNHVLPSPKTATYKHVDRIDAPDDATVIFHLKEPDATLMWNLSEGGIGIVPYGSGADFNRHPIGSGPFRFVRQEQDKEVVLERNPDYWDTGLRPRIARVRFAVVPDATTRALELRKGSADIAPNGSLSADMLQPMRRDPNLQVEIASGSTYNYLAFNLRDPILKDVRVRQAIAYAINREPIIHYLWRDEAEPASSILPPQSWAYDGNVKQYNYDPQRARELLDQAGHPPGADGVRFHITMKTSAEETTRLLAAVFQQQLRDVGIALDIRSLEFTTFFSDVTKGAFQVFSLRWIGGNQDPDIFEYVFHSSSIPPQRANRGYYSNARVDALLNQAREEVDPEKRKPLYDEVQKILAEDLPYVNLWYLDNVVVHTRRVKNLVLMPSGDYGFLKTAELVN
ncbi:MAG TPA: ABC transporter substrate-binding protein [Terriglobales bacterium]|jgi:peptide/nickel transport system substrate-binding protein|nr:ABC transporter substrate-binding protein [Terriglobales bacterium]